MTPSMRPKFSTAVLTMRSAPAGSATLSPLGTALPPAARDLVADLLRRRGAARALAVDRAAEVVDHHLGAFPGGQQRHLAADAAAGAGHQHDLVLQHVGHGRFLSLNSCASMYTARRRRKA